MTADEVSKSGILKKAFRIRPKRKTSKGEALSDPSNSSGGLPALQYGTLDTDSKNIRLLEILPGRNFEPIQTRLRVCSLDESPHDRPSYVALSYMWDHDGQCKHIECEGAKIEVGENLWQFLQQYRHTISLEQQKEEVPVTPARLWIDAISINQKDKQERSYQVALMRDIYTGAKSVIVWLGLAQGFEELAFLLTRHPNLIKIDEMLEALSELLNKPYWRRVWVVQEFVLAKSVDIWCGGFRASAKALEDVWYGKGVTLPYQVKQSAGMHLFVFRRKHRNTAKVKRDTLGRRNSKTFRSTVPLRELLDIFEGARSSETYDKIYGFLGIAADGYGGKIIPNYSIQPVELLVTILRNQCSGTIKKSTFDNYKFLIWLMYTLKVSRAELIRYVLLHCPEAQPHLYVLTVSQFMVVSISFVSTIQNIGSCMEDAEARMPSTWKPTWLQSSMHPTSMSAQDLYDLGQAIATPDIALALDFADAHIPGRSYIGSEILRGEIISASTNLLIAELVRSTVEKENNSNGAGLKFSIQELRKALSKSVAHSAELYEAAEPQLIRRSISDGLERYVSFGGTNGYIGVACIRGSEILAGDRICTFAGISDSNNAFVARLNEAGRWTIVGFAVIVLPPDTHKKSMQRVDTDSTMAGEQTMCFHCHLTDILELQRCRILTKIQTERTLEQTLRLDTIQELHQCDMDHGKLDILEFGG
ncbi:heterokaryon incompatibility protein-domain-containing protein [Phaeosphaeriaceae sp. PMI808]|nr:heterokaryon incompatibility protein-domain-containing protein [Phaeosphaeriaceae sp. PMI808]